MIVKKSKNYPNSLKHWCFTETDLCGVFKWGWGVVGEGIIFFILFFSVNLHAKSCETKTLQEIDLHTRNLKYKNFKIVDIFSLTIESNRQAIRTYHDLAKSCLTNAIIRKISDDLVGFGYPIKYLPGLFGKSFYELGLRFYQIGDQWDRVSISADDNLSEIESAAFKSTAIGGLVREVTHSDRPKLKLYSVGTGFLIQLTQGRYGIATARHVFENNAEKLSAESACKEFVWHFPSGEKFYLRGGQLLFESKELDFAVCELEVPKLHEDFISSRGLRFEENPTSKNQSFVTVGFGVHENDHPGRPLIERSSDCRNFFSSQDVSLKDGKWSLPVGCDSSPGDSGSAVVNSSSGLVSGVLWGTTMVKQGFTSEKLKSLVEDPNHKERLWEELSLMTPGYLISRELKKAGLIPL